MKLARTACIVSAIAMVASSTALAQTDYAAAYGIDEDVPGVCSYESIDAKDYSGRQLNIITHAVPVIGEPTDVHARQFEALTGAKVSVVHVPFGDLFQRILIPFQTGQNAYDVLFYPSLWIGDLNQYLAEVPQAYQETAGFKDVTRNYIDVATWGDAIVQYPMDGDRHYLKFRSDIFGNADAIARFKEATGKGLAIPTTWEDYNEIAHVFSGWDWDGDGNLNYGSAEVTKRDDLMFSAFISRAAPYARNPNVKGGFFFDLETMTPQINNPGFVKGLELFVEASKDWAPGGANWGLGDEIFSFGGGQALMSYSWDDAFVQAQQEDSPIRNKVAAAPLPGAKQVWNRDSGAWDSFEEPNRAAYVTWGWTSAVSNRSQSQDMAFDFLCFFSNEANTLADLQVGRYGVNPYRNAHFDTALWTDRLGWDAELAKSYVETLSGMDDSENRVFDLLVPGVNQFMTALATGVAAALAEQQTPQEALDSVAAEWTSIVDRIGVDTVRDAYAGVVALEDNL